jgi:beta-glucosidase
MPWLNQTKAVLEAWYPGAGGGEAIARMLYGTISPSGRLPITFPQDETQLAHPNIAGVTATSVFDVQFHTDQEVEYREGSEVGYRWFDRRHETPLFAFGFGLTYTQFERSDLAVHAEPNGAIVARFTVRNVGRQAGTDVAQIYVGLPGGGGRRLAGWQRVSLAPGEGRSISVALEPRVLAQFNAGRDRWQIAAGSYRIWLAGHATDNSDGTTVKLEARSLVP